MDMSTDSPLDNWRFFVGEWKGSSKDEFDEKGVVEGTVVFSLAPSERFIMSDGEARRDGCLVNRSISFLFFDKAEQKFRRKTFFSYGFVNNEVEYARSDDEIRFDVKMEPLPKQFEEIRWRSYIRKISDKKVAMGLEMAEKGEEFKRYGESILEKTK
jgi:hypothetical protein